MSIADDVRAPGPTDGGANGPPERYGDSGFDRTPPQDVAAEQCVLGGMLLSKDAVADVVEILRSHDFYRPAHATVFDIVLDLYGRGEPADPITVAAALTDAGDLARVGGAAYLHTLISSVPTAANSAYYARIVAERAVLRRLVEAGTRIVQLGYGSAAGQGRDVDDIVDLAQQAVYDITERRAGDDFAILADLLQPALDEIEAVGSRDGMMAGVPTGFGDLDRLLNGLHPGQLIIVAGRPGLGKALALDTALPTPDGWTTMGEVRAGDRLVGADGRPTTVVATTDVMTGHTCYEVGFSDGSTIVADAGHLWAVTTRAQRRQLSTTRPMSSSLGRAARPMNHATTAGQDGVATTEEIAADIRVCPGKRLNYAVRNARSLELPDAELLVAPYILGVWLGAGHSATATLTTVDPEIVMYVEADELVADQLRSLGVLGDKHIPAVYLRASEAQRRQLLAGLLDTDGTVSPTGDIQFCVTSQRLAHDVYELIVSLGYRCAMTTKRLAGRREDTSTAYTINFSTADDLFRLERKRLAHKERCRTANEARTGHRFIVDVRPVRSVPVRCVSVDNADHLYLAGRSMIPTHNSTVSMDFARNAAVRHNMASAIFSLEMSKIEIVTRLLSAEARVPLHVLRSGQLSDDDWTRLARRMGEISEAPIFVDDTPNMTLMEIRAKARRMRQRNDLKLVVVDYLQLMSSPKRTESRQQEVAELSRGLKLLAKEIECPVIAVSQLNRGPEQRTDKRPQLSDLRESGCLTADTRLVRADTNQEVTLGELMSSQAAEIPVWALDERLKYVPRTLTKAFASGRKSVYRMRLASGKVIDATANHRFLTVDGWAPLERLAHGSRIAVPRHVPVPLNPRRWDNERVILLAHVLGDPAKLRLNPVSGLMDGPPAPIAEWLDDLGLRGLRPHQTFLPPGLSGLPKSQVTLFLRQLWATGGSVAVDETGRGGGVSYESTSRRMLEGVGMLLLRFGVSVRIRQAEVAAEVRPRYQLEISERDSQRRFLQEIGVPGPAATRCAALLSALADTESSANVDTVPTEIWSRVRELLTRNDTGRRTFPAAVETQFGGSTILKHAPGRQPLALVAAVLDAADLELDATNDVFWDTVVSVTASGEADVFDATVLGLHNFIANGIATHNSIEQDADVVLLLHRDDYYDKESPRAGEADFIVAKHRNGPTDTITVAAQLHYSRFVDMAIS